jgi:hypothetical protein
VGFFEEQPLLLVPVIIITIEVWSVVKAAVVQLLTRARSVHLANELGGSAASASGRPSRIVRR